MESAQEDGAPGSTPLFISGSRSTDDEEKPSLRCGMMDPSGMTMPRSLCSTQAMAETCQHTDLLTVRTWRTDRAKEIELENSATMTERKGSKALGNRGNRGNRGENERDCRKGVSGMQGAGGEDLPEGCGVGPSVESPRYALMTYAREIQGENGAVVEDFGKPCMLWCPVGDPQVMLIESEPEWDWVH